MCDLLTPRNEQEETFGVSRALHDGPICDDCGEPTTEHGTCPDCTAVRRELEADDVWPVWLASLKYGADDMDALDDKLAGWKYVGAKVDHERTSKGVAIASANDLCFIAPGKRGHLVFSRHESGGPIVTIIGGDIKYPDWSAIFTANTPHSIILATCTVIHTNQ